MPAVKIIPGRDVLAHWVDEGLTQVQMVERIHELTGERVSRQAVSMALQRNNLTAATRPRHRDEIPWRVAEDHAGQYQARMLRLLGRRRAGETLSESDASRLDNWMHRLEQRNLVVGYHTVRGFVYVRRHPSDDIMPPIRRQYVRFADEG